MTVMIERIGYGERENRRDEEVVEARNAQEGHDGRLEFESLRLCAGTPSRIAALGTVSKFEP
jgi:hypothetical protein